MLMQNDIIPSDFSMPLSDGMKDFSLLWTTSITLEVVIVDDLGEVKGLLDFFSMCVSLTTKFLD